ncbi:MAG: nucleotidyltransferase domain-containing protein [Halanaerobiales bacterium]
MVIVGLDTSPLNLKPQQEQALTELKNKIKKKYEIEEILIFGSVARNEADQESDLDVLVLTKDKLSHEQKHVIYGITTEINLEYGTNISILLIQKSSWENGLYSILAIKEEVERDGVSFQ